MSTHLTPHRRTVLIPAALLLAAALACAPRQQAAALSGAAQGSPACVQQKLFTEYSGSCVIGGYTAQFGSATGGINESTQTIWLTSGWVWMTPVSEASQRVQAEPKPVKVATTYAVGGVSSMQPTYDLANARSSTKSQNTASFLVVAETDATAVALVSGTMQTPENLTAGCEVRYTSPGGGPGQSFPITSDPVVVPILSGLGVDVSDLPPCSPS